MTLEGKKTYITAAVLGLASFALAMHWINNDQYQIIMGLLGSLGLAALRSGVTRSNADKPKEAGHGEVAPASGATPAAPSTVVGNA